MWDLILKIWFFIVILPFTIAQEGYAKLKAYLGKHNYKPEWMYILLIFLIIFLIILFFLQYGYH